ncbi:hypothetical protein ACHAXA_005174 [Cyclostephanos tholiformis]|uniref:Uncharacterized protein n=1 Tax=Cyclostephanos tholiformis TaxID=382380 RepID=A0ABD3RFZ3_9STRA
MKTPQLKQAPPSRLVLAAAIILVIASLGRCSGIAAAEVAVDAAVVTMDTCSTTPPADANAAVPPPNDRHRHDVDDACRAPPPPEHRDSACDRAAQNARRIAEHERNENLGKGELIPDVVYLALPEERTWICPPDDDGGVTVTRSHERDRLGAPSRWVVYNRSSGPVMILRANEDGIEVPATNVNDGGNANFDNNNKKKSKKNDIGESERGYAESLFAATTTAVWPNGPILLQGSYAVVEGRQGHVYVVREYEEALSPYFVEHVLPRTMSFPPRTDDSIPEVGGWEQRDVMERRWTRFVGNDGTLRVSGRPGMILMRHRMGNIYVRNANKVPCPLVLQDVKPANAGRKGNPKDFNPSCNVMNKAFINKVGCPIDIYFSPRTWEGHDEGGGDPKVLAKEDDMQCEIFSRHLGPLGPFLQSAASWSNDPTVRNPLDDGWLSPLMFLNTYNRHSFVARMSHDKSLVARIDLDHDVVVDCPEPSRRAFEGFEEKMTEEEELEAMIIDEAAADALWQANSTKSALYAFARKSVDAKVHNATAARLFLGGDTHDRDNVGIISSSVLIS